MLGQGAITNRHIVYPFPLTGREGGNERQPKGKVPSEKKKSGTHEMGLMEGDKKERRRKKRGTGSGSLDSSE